MKTYQAIKTDSGRWVHITDGGVFKCTNKPELYDPGRFQSEKDYEALLLFSKKDTGENCHVVPVVVLEAGEFPSEDYLLGVLKDPRIQDYCALATFLRKLAAEGWVK